MGTSVESTQGSPSHTSSIVMWVLVAVAGTPPLSRGVTLADSHSTIASVVFLFGAGTYLRLGYRRWARSAPGVEDSRPRPFPPRLGLAGRISSPASGVVNRRVDV